MQVYYLMNTSVVTVRPDTSASEASRLMRHWGVGALPVASPEGRLKGIVTDRDIVLRCVADENDPRETTVNDVMSRRVVTVQADADVREAADVMAREQVRRLPVTREGKLVGILSLADLARARSCDAEAAHALSEISSSLKHKS